MAEFINVQGGGGGVSSEVKITDGTNTVEVTDDGALTVDGSVLIKGSGTDAIGDTTIKVVNATSGGGTFNELSVNVKNLSSQPVPSTITNTPTVKIDATQNTVKVNNSVVEPLYVRPIDSIYGLPVEIKNDYQKRIPVEVVNPNGVQVNFDINNNAVKIEPNQTIGISGTPSVNATITGTPTVKLDSTDNTVKLDSFNNTVKIEAGQAVGITGTPSVNATVTNTPTIKIDGTDNTVKLDSTNNTVKIAADQYVSISGTPTVQVSGNPSVNATIIGTPSVNAAITGTPNVNATITGTPSVTATVSGTVTVANPTESVSITGTPTVTATISGTPSVNATVTGTPTVKIDQTQNGVSTSKSNSVKVTAVQLQPVANNVSTILAGVVGKKFRILTVSIAGLPGAFSAVIALQSTGSSTQTFYRYRHSATAIYDRYINYGVDGIVLDEANASIQILSNQTYTGTQFIDVVIVYEEV